MLRQGRKRFHKELRHPVTCILHENQARDPQLHSAPVHGTHLLGGEHLHAHTSGPIITRIAVGPCAGAAKHEAGRP